MVALREYQVEGIRKIFEAWSPTKLNIKDVLFQMPTGTGKTTVFSEIVRRARIKNKTILLVAHRKELVDQIRDRLLSFGITVGIIAAGTKPTLDCEVQVATIQSLSQRSYPPADIVIIDECHHAKAATYKKLWHIYPEARFLGVTATPTRLNGQGFDTEFQKLICLGSLSYFIEKGYLCKMKHLVCGIPNLSKVKLKLRDYDIQMLKNVMLDNSIMANIVESYKKFANGKKAIVFAVDVEHSKNIVQRYTEANIPAAHLDAKTKKSERREILRKFKEGEILVLSNVDIVSEGFDVPNCEAVQLARPTKSLSLYLQQVGRCMRPSEGKEHGIVLDNAGLWLEHGLSYIDRDWKLEGNRKKKNNVSLRDVVGIDEEGVVREVNRPVEVEGLELLEVTEEIARLLVFESYLRNAKTLEHKLVSVAYKYSDYLVSTKANFSEFEIQYCHKRINKEGGNYKIGFWYYRKTDVEERLKDND
jgi:superfamily II DNA or RNA helicase